MDMDIAYLVSAVLEAIHSKGHVSMARSVYTCLAATDGLFTRFYLFQSYSTLCPARPHLADKEGFEKRSFGTGIGHFSMEGDSLLRMYLASYLTPGLCRIGMGVFLAPGYENMPVQAPICLLPWRWDSPITYLPICFGPQRCIHDWMRTLIFNETVTLRVSPWILKSFVMLAIPHIIS